MLKTERQTIEGLEVRTTQLPALRAFSLLTKLGRILGPALGKISKLSMESDVGPLLGDLFERLSQEELEALVLEVLVSTQVVIDGRQEELTNQEAINRVFQGNLKALLFTLAFVVRANYADFFGSLASVTNDSEGEKKPKPS